MPKYNIHIEVDETMTIEAENQEEAIEKFLDWFVETDLSELVTVEK